MSAQPSSPVSGNCQDVRSENIVPAGHGAKPRDVGDIPYRVTFSNLTAVSGDTITVTISGANFLTRTELKGFLLQVLTIHQV